MRGLTDEERICVETWRSLDLESTSDDVIDAVIARGLITVDYCSVCGSDDDTCLVCDGYEYYNVTADGLLALRLDAAARALTGAPA